MKLFLVEMSRATGKVSWRWEVRRYIEIEGGDEGILLWKGGDFGGRRGSGEMVAV